VALRFPYQTLTLSTGRVIPTRWVGEQHVQQDLGFIPSFADWMRAIRPLPWMGRAGRLEDRPLPYMRVQLSTTFLRSVLRTWVGEEQRSPWGPGRFCIAASACVTLQAVGSYRGPAL
jgi:uncharacterized protein DUF6915